MLYHLWPACTENAGTQQREPVLPKVLSKYNKVFITRMAKTNSEYMYKEIGKDILSITELTMKELKYKTDIGDREEKWKMECVWRPIRRQS